MSDAASALALMIVPGAAAPAPAAGVLAAKAAGAALPAPDAEGFAFYVLAAAAAQAPKTPKSVAETIAQAAGELPPAEAQIEIKPKTAKTATAETVEKTPDEESGEAPSVSVVALATQPLIQEIPVEAKPMTEDAKTALIAKAKESGEAAKAEAAESADPRAADEAQDPAAPETGGETPDAVSAEDGAGEAPTTLSNIPAAEPEAPAKPTPPPAPVDAETAAKTLAAVSAADLLPPEPILSDPATVLGDARKDTEAKAAAGQALGAQTSVLAKARDLVEPPVAPPQTLPRAAERAVERANEQSKVASIDVPQAPARPAERPAAPQAVEPPRARPEPPAATPSSSPPVQNAAPAPGTAAQADPSGESPPATSTATSPAGSAPLPHGETRPLPMTVIRADVQTGTASLPAEHIAVTIARQFREGTNRFEIRLDPPELGRIDVRLDLAHGGRATATLTVDRPETLHLLTRDARVLEQTLSDAGLRTDSGSLNFALRDQTGRQAQHDQGQGQHAPRLPAEAENAADAKPPVTLIATLEPGRLDLRV